MSSPNALLLLADHLKLSLLERQRAKTLGLASDSQDGHISRSLDQFRDGLQGLEDELARLRAPGGDEVKAARLDDTLSSLKRQFADLTAQFHGFASPAAGSAGGGDDADSISDTLTSPNDPLLAGDFAHAQSTRGHKKTASGATKTVRFSDAAPRDLESQLPPLPSDGGRDALFRYRDDPAAGADTAGYRDRIEAGEDGSAMSNVQVHAYHQQILAEQDAQLDALGASIGRQRELSMQIGDELDNHVMMLDESERVVDRHQSTLDRARRQVGRIARGASESRQMVAIVVLIIILVLLIAVLK
ncbi:hypothetical protein B0T26DRAFT_651966 [Lasiosphaeria miniovina]|uniref:t-SNARE coiled-coil homology domain-containing protein n=1 Tax=Lasiosphaeria miniovina TaxID=1954250 RepID=A0AA40A471_9PEZI|nr:uncharacterized protein B0T26DRAFT_651966 [Lasiosphaeria miniovina]KAK0708946.1 hypothetical protein B0T26DRAFT_651966 [Lasiosphaeria miniovina]